ncbi:MAG: response regulator [Sphaerochaetaceae bacterium]|jgi:YesN/AraC family two-component response regulator|nr:response regulator [Sphaerochaetaceae bacterium]MDC7237295.1 response regulator [Sphaerochaetaceae bacterium]MDC7250076.1 response regulator [Sphaerochaetaceae bacterium]
MYSILIADDEELEREVLSLFIKKSNLPINNIIIAEDGNDAFVKLVCDKPDIAILDINMPELSGLDVLEKIRKEKLDTKVLISTAFDEFDYAVKALKLGATDFLVKPVLKKNFLNAIENTISKLDLENKNKTKMEQLDNVIEYFKNNSMSNLTHSNDTIPEAVVLIKNFIEENYSNYISLDDIVSGCGYSKYHISRLFKNYMNCTIMEYLLKQRLTKAKDLLVKTSYSIKEIALATGFSDPNYFSLIFKREEGISPIQYRAAKK